MGSVGSVLIWQYVCQGPFHLLTLLVVTIIAVVALLIILFIAASRNSGV